MTTPDELLGGRYRLRSELGRGGVGIVWLARDKVLNRDVAIKEVVLPAILTSDERAIQLRRTMREARLSARIRHPNVVAVFDVVEYDRRPWIVMEYVRSVSLAQLSGERGPLPAPEVAEAGLQLLSALAAAHSAGIMHRDVKPGNVLVAEDGRAVLTDFGIATLEGDSSLTRTGTLVGSPAYIAPERARGSAATPASDLFSLGVTLYSAVEGRSPFDRGSPLATLAAVTTDEPDPAILAGPLLAPILDGLLRKDPAQRLTAAETAALLRPLAARATGSLGSAPGSAGGRAGGLSSSTLAALYPATGSFASAGSRVPARQAPSRKQAGRDPGPGGGQGPGGVQGPGGDSAPGQRRGGLLRAARRVTSRALPGAAVPPAIAAASAGPSAAALATPASAPAGPPGEQASGDAAAKVSTEAPLVAAPQNPSTADTATPEPAAPEPAAAAPSAPLPRAAGQPPAATSPAGTPAAAVQSGGAPPVSAPPSADAPAGHGGSGSGLSRVPSRFRLPLALLVLLVAVVVIAWLGRPDRVAPKPHAQRSATASHSAAPPSPAGGAAAPAPSAVGSASPTPSPSPAAPPSGRAALPAGWRWYQDQTGFGLGIPAGWNVSRDGDGNVTISDPNGPGSLLIEQTSQPKADAAADWRSREPQRRATTPGYVLIGIRTVPDYFVTTADWEYLRTRGGTQVHMIIRGTKTSDHQAYGIHWETPAAQWASNKHFFDTFTATFTPAP